jgi:membrane associated rhomboid family serine protease
LRNILIIVLLQLAFDVVTPRVSMSAHLGGLFTGFLLGLVVPRKSGFQLDLAAKHLASPK